LFIENRAINSLGLAYGILVRGGVRSQESGKIGIIEEAIGRIVP